MMRMLYKEEEMLGLDAIESSKSILFKFVKSDIKARRFTSIICFNYVLPDLSDVIDDVGVACP